MKRATPSENDGESTITSSPIVYVVYKIKCTTDMKDYYSFHNVTIVGVFDNLDAAQKKRESELIAIVESWCDDIFDNGYDDEDCAELGPLRAMFNADTKELKNQQSALEAWDLLRKMRNEIPACPPDCVIVQASCYAKNE